MKIKQFLAMTLCAFLISPNAFASNFSLGKGLSFRDFGNRTGSEFFSGSHNKETLLVKINLWGGVNQPGIHHVPINTDLLTLISYAGGPNQFADLDEVVIKRRVGKEEKRIVVNVSDILAAEKNGGEIPIIRANDIVVVPESIPIPQSTLSTFTFIATLLSIVGSGLVLATQVAK